MENGVTLNQMFARKLSLNFCLRNAFFVEKLPLTTLIHLVQYFVYSYHHSLFLTEVYLYFYFFSFLINYSFWTRVKNTKVSVMVHKSLFPRDFHLIRLGITFILGQISIRIPAISLEKQESKKMNYKPVLQPGGHITLIIRLSLLYRKSSNYSPLQIELP